MNLLQHIKALPILAGTSRLLAVFAFYTEVADLLRGLAAMVEEPGLGVHLVLGLIALWVLPNLWESVQNIHATSTRPWRDRRKAKRKAESSDYDGIPVSKSLVRPPQPNEALSP